MDTLFLHYHDLRGIEVDIGDPIYPCTGTLFYLEDPIVHISFSTFWMEINVQTMEYTLFDHTSNTRIDLTVLENYHRYRIPQSIHQITIPNPFIPEEKYGIRKSHLFQQIEALQPGDTCFLCVRDSMIVHQVTVKRHHPGEQLIVLQDNDDISPSSWTLKYSHGFSLWDKTILMTAATPTTMSYELLSLSSTWISLETLFMEEQGKASTYLEYTHLVREKQKFQELVRELHRSSRSEVVSIHPCCVVIVKHAFENPRYRNHSLFHQFPTYHSTTVEDLSCILRESGIMPLFRRELNPWIYLYPLLPSTEVDNEDEIVLLDEKSVFYYLFEKSDTDWSTIHPSMCHRSFSTSFFRSMMQSTLSHENHVPRFNLFTMVSSILLLPPPLPSSRKKEEEEVVQYKLYDPYAIETFRHQNGTISSRTKLWKRILKKNNHDRVLFEFHHTNYGLFIDDLRKIDEIASRFHGDDWSSTTISSPDVILDIPTSPFAAATIEIDRPANEPPTRVSVLEFPELHLTSNFGYDATQEIPSWVRAYFYNHPLYYPFQTFLLKKRSFLRKHHSEIYEKQSLAREQDQVFMSSYLKKIKSSFVSLSIQEQHETVCHFFCTTILNAYRTQESSSSILSKYTHFDRYLKKTPYFTDSLYCILPPSPSLVVDSPISVAAIDELLPFASSPSFLQTTTFMETIKSEISQLLTHPSSDPFLWNHCLTFVSNHLTLDQLCEHWRWLIILYHPTTLDHRPTIHQYFQNQFVSPSSPPTYTVCRLCGEKISENTTYHDLLFDTEGSYLFQFIHPDEKKLSKWSTLHDKLFTPIKEGTPVSLEEQVLYLMKQLSLPVTSFPSFREYYHFCDTLFQEICFHQEIVRDQQMLMLQTKHLLSAFTRKCFYFILHYLQKKLLPFLRPVLENIVRQTTHLSTSFHLYPSSDITHIAWDQCQYHGSSSLVVDSATFQSWKQTFYGSYHETNENTSQEAYDKLLRHTLRWFPLPDKNKNVIFQRLLSHHSQSSMYVSEFLQYIKYFRNNQVQQWVPIEMFLDIGTMLYEQNADKASLVFKSLLPKIKPFLLVNTKGYLRKHHLPLRLSFDTLTIQPIPPSLPPISPPFYSLSFLFPRLWDVFQSNLRDHQVYYMRDTQLGVFDIGEIDSYWKTTSPISPSPSEITSSSSSSLFCISYHPVRYHSASPTLHVDLKDKKKVSLERRTRDTTAGIIVAAENTVWKAFDEVYPSFSRIPFSIFLRQWKLALSKYTYSSYQRYFTPFPNKSYLLGNIGMESMKRFQVQYREPWHLISSSSQEEDRKILYSILQKSISGSTMVRFKQMIMKYRTKYEIVRVLFERCIEHCEGMMEYLRDLYDIPQIKEKTLLLREHERRKYQLRFEKESDPSMKSLLYWRQHHVSETTIANQRSLVL